MTTKSKDWPAWYNGPDGETEIFHSADDVPAGWTTGAEKSKPEKAAKAKKSAEPESEPKADLPLDL